MSLPLPHPALRTWLGLAALLAVAPSAARADVIVPKPDTDWTANRVDCEVFGWDKEFTQVASVCLWLKREPLGRIRGEGLLVVFPVEQPQAVHNVQVKFFTQPDLPHDPVPLTYAKDILDAIDYDYARMWPKRPVKKRPRQAMAVELVWDKVEVEPKLCQVAVGFKLSWKGEQRFQPHKLLKEVKADCELLRLFDSPIYWGKGDVAVAQPRFDYSPTKNEQSFRQPVSALWRLSRPLELRVRTSLPVVDPAVAKAKQELARYGKVRVTSDASCTETAVAASAELRVLGERVGRALTLGRSVTPPASGVDVEVLLAPAKTPEDEKSPSAW